MFMFRLQPLYSFTKVEYDIGHIAPEPTEAEKKRSRFGSMFMLHQMLNRAGVKHENAGTLICSGYRKTKDRF